MSALLVLAVVTALAATVLSLDLVLGLRALPALGDVPISPNPEPAGPAVSIVVPARDEARHIAVAVQTLLSQDYSDLEVVVVDDRSTDGTAGVLDGMAASHQRLRVLHVDALPSGWLGKNHALALGAAAASGELLLFTDADVMMAPDTVRRAVWLLRDRRADHLAVAPRIHSGSAWATTVIAVFLVLFSTVFRPWKARDPRSRHHIGIGAFNLVRAEAYRSIGGHRAVAMRPDDDVRLGRALKRAGFRQEAASGRDSVSVEWYDTLTAMVRGFRKNSFAVVEYRLSLVAAGTLLPLLFIFWPLAALLLAEGAVWWTNAAVVALGLLTTGYTARGHGLPLWTAPAYPIGSILLLWMVWAAALRAVVKGSVEWRGREYPLNELRGR